MKKVQIVKMDISILNYFKMVMNFDNESEEYKNAIIWLNCTTLVTWGIFLFIHGWNTFKGRILFKKSWEERKIKEYMEADETKTWE